MEKLIKTIKIIKFMGRTDFDTLDSVVQDHLVKQVNYNTSWDDLIPVVNKIEGISMGNEDEGTDNSFNVKIVGLRCTISDAYGELIDIDVTENTKIKSVYEAVVKFIDYYNKFSY